MEPILKYDYFKVVSYLHRYMKKRFGNCSHYSDVIFTERDRINVTKRLNTLIKVSNMENVQLVFEDFKITNIYMNRMYTNCMNITYGELEKEFIPFYFIEEVEHLSAYVLIKPELLPQGNLQYYFFNRTKFEYFFSFTLVDLF